MEKFLKQLTSGKSATCPKGFIQFWIILEKKYGYDADEYNHLLLEKKELETFLEVVEKGKIFEHSDFEEWFRSYGTYYYRRIDENGNYIDEEYDREKDEWHELALKIKEDIKLEFLEELKKDLGKLFYYAEDEEEKDEVAFSYSA